MWILYITLIISKLPFNKIYKTIKTFRRKYKLLILLLTHLLIIIYFIKLPKKENIIYTKQFLYENLEKKELFKERNKFIFNYKIKKESIEFFIKEDINDFQTIHIFGNFNQINEFFNLMIELSKLKYFPRNLKIILCSNPKIHKIRSFLIINLEFSINENILKYNLFDRCTPNSDLLFFIQKFYYLKYKFLPFILNTKFYDLIQNKINISILNNKESLNLFSTTIRFIMNLESHSLGSYYYLPGNKGHFSLYYIFPIFFLIYFNEFDSFEESFNFIFNLKDLIIILFSFYKPIILFIFLNKTGLNLIAASIYLFILSFNWGILFIYLIWIKQIIKLLINYSFSF